MYYARDSTSSIVARQENEQIRVVGSWSSWIGLGQTKHFNTRPVRKDGCARVGAKDTILKRADVHSVSMCDASSQLLAYLKNLITDLTTRTLHDRASLL